MDENRKPRKRKNFSHFDFLELVNQRFTRDIDHELKRGLHNFVVEWLKANDISFDYSYLNRMQYNDNAGKTFPVSLLKTFVNIKLESVIAEKVEKRMAASMLEEVLFLTDNYRGFNNLTHPNLTDDMERIYY